MASDAVKCHAQRVGQEVGQAGGCWGGQGDEHTRSGTKPSHLRVPHSPTRPRDGLTVLVWEPDTLRRKPSASSRPQALGVDSECPGSCACGMSSGRGGGGGRGGRGGGPRSVTFSVEAQAPMVEPELTEVGELHSLTDWQVSEASEEAELDEFCSRGGTT